MKLTQYKVVNNETGELLGWLVGKMPKGPNGNPALIVQRKNFNVILEINDKTSKRFRVEAVEVSNV